MKKNTKKLYFDLDKQARRVAKDEAKYVNKLKDVSLVVESMAKVDFSEMKIPLIVLYYDTIDFPGQYVARVFEIDKPTQVCCTYKSKKAAREDAIKAGFNAVIPRNADDFYCIVETYMYFSGGIVDAEKPKEEKDIQ